MRRIGFKPSPAMMVAFLALLVALAGTSYAAIQLPANSVGTKQLKKNAVTSKKVKNRSLKAIDFATGQLPAGPQGPQGAQGPQGPTGPSGATNVTVRTSAEGLGITTATCQGNERAVGGGALSTDGYLVAVGPNATSGTPNGWAAQADDGAGGDAHVRVSVVCAAP
jgi:hypothetical protein